VLADHAQHDSTPEHTCCRRELWLSMFTAASACRPWISRSIAAFLSCRSLCIGEVTTFMLSPNVVARGVLTRRPSPPVRCWAVSGLVRFQDISPAVAKTQRCARLPSPSCALYGSISASVTSCHFFRMLKGGGPWLLLLLGVFPATPWLVRVIDE
jgi:hypothetical protein